ncbi:carbohydrate kinase family protein [Symbioplanes lichenis]|uniref:carbohydrate kinase family protein n=1 Tax=Symbioplanes lichenis TaxID=1629072 RepID=UPI00273A25FB|nr:carbohydrate kinase family protein [Actinoplanes lichenis]
MTTAAVVVVGDLVTDILVEQAGPPAPGSDTDARIRISGGGQAANTAAWLAHAGADVTLIAAAGDDDAGRERVAELEAGGVRCAVRHHAGATTGSIVVLTSPHERTMITDRGAALLLDPADVRAAIAAAQARHLHLSGYPLLHAGSRPGGLAALAAARDKGLTTSVDAASAAPLRSLPGFLDLVRDTDLLLCNTDEATALAGAGTAEEQAGRLLGHAAHVIVKRGEHGAVWRSRTGQTWHGRAVSVPSIDPTGAGDAFAAGLLHAWLGGQQPEAALAAAATLGAAAVQKLGARP